MNFLFSHTLSLSLLSIDFTILSVGLIQSFFEAAMYIFVFLYCPILEEAHKCKFLWIRNKYINIHIYNIYIYIYNILLTIHSLIIYIYIYFLFLIILLLQKVGGHKDELPFGLIFAGFMICIMIGSRIFNILMQNQWKVITISLPIFLLGTVSMLLPIVTMVNKHMLILKKKKNIYV